jgi:hypothetical protein
MGSTSKIYGISSLRIWLSRLSAGWLGKISKSGDGEVVFVRASGILIPFPILKMSPIYF